MFGQEQIGDQPLALIIVKIIVHFTNLPVQTKHGNVRQKYKRAQVIVTPIKKQEVKNKRRLIKNRRTCLKNQIEQITKFLVSNLNYFRTINFS